MQKILIFEDEELIRWSLSTILQKLFPEIIIKKHENGEKPEGLNLDKDPLLVWTDLSFGEANKSSLNSDHSLHGKCSFHTQKNPPCPQKNKKTIQQACAKTTPL